MARALHEPVFYRAGVEPLQNEQDKDNKEIAQLCQQLQEKENIISAMKTKAKEKDSELNRMQLVVEEKTKIISTLKRNLVSCLMLSDKLKPL